MPEIVAPWQQRLEDLGLQVDLVVVLDQTLQEIAASSGQFVGPLQDVAFASLGVLGNLIFMIFLSLFIVIDKDHLLGFVNRVTPPRYAPEVRLFQTSVASSFGGFMRGQAIQGLLLGSIAAAGSLLLDIDYMPLTTALVAFFQFIPFFGPFVSWAPPVVAAILTQPDAIIPIAVIMGVGWFVTMNFVQPRVMASSVGIHPVVVLVSVLIGLRLQGVVGAIFAIPVAAVISAFFFHYLKRSQGGPRDVASRAARRARGARGPTGAGARHHRWWAQPPGGRQRPRASRPTIRRHRRGADMTDEQEQTAGEQHDPPVGAGRQRSTPVDALTGSLRRPRRRWPPPGATSRPPEPRRARPSRCPSGRRGRASSSPTTTASSRAVCWRSSRRSSPSATSTSWRPTRTSRPWATP